MLDLKGTHHAINELCQRLRIKNLDIFGSAATDDIGPGSDVDVLVRFDRDGTDLFDRYFELKEGLEQLFERDVESAPRRTSMQLEVKKCLFDIVQAASDIEGYTVGLSYSGYASNGIVQAAAEA